MLAQNMLGPIKNVGKKKIRAINYFLPYSDRLQRQRLYQNIGGESTIQKYSLTFQIMFQASSVYKGCK